MITREEYKAIKKMNRDQLDTYLDSIYSQGYNQGIVNMSAVVVQKIDIGLRNSPSIGEKRYKEIMDNITAAMQIDDEILSPTESE